MKQQLTKETTGATMYSQFIQQVTGVTGDAALAAIEECMRQHIFHSTLDWQTADEFDQGAKEAVALLLDTGVLELHQQERMP